ncbi:sensor histidine kinase [Achromobacter xylosoxidans]|uniref:sensor histidine kinase n=1 Tax=Alcaligenes xylosoxydans xylosoxydans TaxID=85698 RepID=UPI0006AC8632|nr:HAMP domain-containing sensor histidine kinase [Achromobacter xylosoxidans]KOQ20686.1 histidine kinase [Achromobacter xylosoxidans]KOQ28065.1 histidine kinase [Achromobacter xylosoxidans]KOQ30985.1 histidine kinase [Achromobacter xylosoxidans]KOQ39883.1 histidine kinase [Achromobacter xylosoxidans]KOQ41070.1 histidine kinase [Achromobacter xylosoxidans]
MRSARRGLARYLVRTYLLLALLVGGVLTWVSIWSVNTLEVHLQRIDMGMAVERVRGDFLAGIDPGRPHRFFHGEPGGPAFPQWLRGLAPGFHKIEREGRIWHVMVDDKDGQRYMLLRDYTEYEHNQSASHWTVVSGLAGGLALAFVLGTLATRRMLRPLARLAAQVTARGAQPPQTRLAEDYPPDEIGRLAAAFDATYNQLEQALRREQLFTADVGHELRTPLMVISSSCELLLEEPGLDADGNARLRRIAAAAADIGERLDTYLMLARGRDDAGQFARASADEAAREQLAAWSAVARRRGMSLTLQAAAGPSPSNAAAGAPADVFDRGAAPGPSGADGMTPAMDPPRFPAPLLRALLSNLIRNSLQYAGPGARVTISAGAQYLQVADDGPGIPAERQQAVFSPFVRGTQPAAGNLGLGLSLVQRICEHQGWRVSLQSAPGRGSVFRVDLGTTARS